MMERTHTMRRIAAAIGLAASLAAWTAGPALAFDARSPDTREAAEQEPSSVVDRRSPDTRDAAQARGVRYDGLTVSPRTSLGAAMLAAAVASSPSVELQAAKAATARYHSFKQAKRDGYTIAGEPCVASPDGTMGIHAVNRSLETDPAIDPLRPEILLYVPKRNGKLMLVGLEYLKVDADQDLATNDDRPSLFGQPFDGPMEGHGPGMPVHYDLHVWVWKANPSGLFAPFNPSVSC
jgi:hypothetical protein